MAHTPPQPRIVLFGGTFDPVHHAHLITAQAAREALAADRLMFVPAGQSPHKAEAQVAAAEHRVAMLRAAIADVPTFGVHDLELTRPGPSYTIDTVRALQAAPPTAHYILLMGADQLASLHTWHQAAELVQIVEIAVLARPDVDAAGGLQIVAQHLGRPAADRLRRGLLHTPLIAISATDIRARIATGRSIRYLLPRSVEDYIRRHRLYGA